MYRRSKGVPSAEPWRTPEETGASSDCSPLSTNFWVWPMRKASVYKWLDTRHHSWLFWRQTSSGLTYRKLYKKLKKQASGAFSSSTFEFHEYQAYIYMPSSSHSVLNIYHGSLETKFVRVPVSTSVISDNTRGLMSSGTAALLWFTVLSFCGHHSDYLHSWC